VCNGVAASAASAAVATWRGGSGSDVLLASVLGWLIRRPRKGAVLFERHLERPRRHIAAPRTPQCTIRPAPASGRFLRTPTRKPLARAPRPGPPPAAPQSPQMPLARFSPSSVCTPVPIQPFRCLPRTSFMHRAKRSGPITYRYGETSCPTTGRRQSTAQGRRPAWAAISVAGTQRR